MTLVTLNNHLSQHHNHHDNNNNNNNHHHHHHNCDRTCNIRANISMNNTINNINREELTYQHSVIPEVASQIISKQQASNITTNMSNNQQQQDQQFLTSNQQPKRHKNSTSSSVDPYSSLNLSSMGSSSNGSSAQHSPLLVGGDPTCQNNHHNNNNNKLSSHQLAEQLANSCQVATSDYSRATSISCSPTTSPISCELLDSSTTTSSSNDEPPSAQSCDTTTSKQQQELSHLHLPTCQQQQQQKVRSFSHSNTFSPLIAGAGQLAVVSPTHSSGRHSTIEVKNGDEDEEQLQQQQQPLSELIIQQRPRRLSRIEHRQSFLDLGYGKIESYFKLQRLGKGTYATVYMGRSRMSNDLVALKEILKEHDEGAPCTAIREVSLLRLLRHNNIVTLHDICHTPKKLTLVFEYVGPDLYAYMKKNNNLLSIHNVRILLYQLLRGISFCHTRQVLHRDLKPQNLLINSRGELKICDFGLARAKSIPTKSYSNEVVTLWYRPPDVLLGNTDYDHSIDMWGVGCIFYEMASGRTFFPGSSVRQQLYLIFSSLGAPNKYNWPEILANPEYQSYSFPPFRPEKLSHRVPRLDSNGVILLMSFLRFKPQERISAEEARRDPFFACLPEAVHQLGERESIFDVPGVYMTLNPGQKLNHHI